MVHASSMLDCPKRSTLRDSYTLPPPPSADLFILAPMKEREREEEGERENNVGKANFRSNGQLFLNLKLKPLPSERRAVSRTLIGKYANIILFGNACV